MTAAKNSGQKAGARREKKNKKNVLKKRLCRPEKKTEHLMK